MMMNAKKKMATTERAQKICLVGAMSVRKSTVADRINTILKSNGVKSVVCEEYAREYIMKFGKPVFPWEQYAILLGQKEKEELLVGSNYDLVICDSSVILSFIYANYMVKDFKCLMTPMGTPDLEHIDRKLNKLKKDLYEEVINYIPTYNRIYYLPPIGKEVIEDGVRFGDKETQGEVDKMLLGFLCLEGIPYVTAEGSTVDERADVILEDLGYNYRATHQVATLHQSSGSAIASSGTFAITSTGCNVYQGGS